MKKAISYLTSACVIFTLLTIGLHIAEFALGGGIVALSKQLLLLLACLLFAASNRILGAERLPIGVRMFLHYVAIGVVFFAVLGIVGRTVTKSLQVFILLVCITVLYLLFAVFYLLLRRRKKAKQESQNEYKSMF
ncbi:MAG: DUF3021 family protein [Clostridiales bacterium]|jgi:hypothetical protein|nr:DUF3021 family protein [Clostridiales bacterium]